MWDVAQQAPNYTTCWKDGTCTKRVGPRGPSNDCCWKSDYFWHLQNSRKMLRIVEDGELGSGQRIEAEMAKVLGLTEEAGTLKILHIRDVAKAQKPGRDYEFLATNEDIEGQLRDELIRVGLMADPNASISEAYWHVACQYLLQQAPHVGDQCEICPADLENVAVRIGVSCDILNEVLNECFDYAGQIPDKRHFSGVKHKKFRNGYEYPVSVFVRNHAGCDFPDRLRRRAARQRPRQAASTTALPEKVKRLLKKYGFQDLQQKKHDGDTALHRVLQDGDVQGALLLLQHGADPNEFNLDGQTALHIAQKIFPNDHTPLRMQATQLLLQSAADINASSETHGTALDLCCTGLGSAAGPSDVAERAQFLLQHGAESSGSNVFRAAFSMTPDLLQVLLAHGDSANARGNAKLAESCGTPLHMAASFPRPQNMRLLLQHGARVDAINKDGQTPLHKVAREGSEDALECVQMLLQCKANANARDKKGKKPLDFAGQGFKSKREPTEKIIRLLKAAK